MPRFRDIASASAIALAGPRYPHRRWLGGLVRAHEALAALVKPDTRIVPAEGRVMTGADTARHRCADRRKILTIVV